MANNPLVSIVVPIHDMKNGAHFLWRLVNSLCDQTVRDYELIITREGKMAENTNAGIKRARGEYIKILYLDDEFAHPQALAQMLTAIEGHDWLICGASTNPEPYWTDDIESGNNKLGSPSALMIRNDSPLLFDERLSWLLDCAYYKMMNERCGKPAILNGVHVNIGVGDHQMTHLLTDEEKMGEHYYLQQHYG